MINRPANNHQFTKFVQDRAQLGQALQCNGVRLLIYLAGPIVEDAINREGPVADSNGVRSSVADKPRSLSSTGRLTVGRTLTTTCAHTPTHHEQVTRLAPKLPSQEAESGEVGA